MIIKEEIIKKDNKYFNTQCFVFNYKSDENNINNFILRGKQLASVLNPTLARDSSQARSFNIVKINAIAGVISEFCWKYFLQEKINKFKKNIKIETTGMNNDKNQVDLLIAYNENKNKAAEVRSSFPYKGVESAVIKNMDIIGWYCNEVKIKEVKKDFYLRALFPYKINEFVNFIKKEFKVFLTGGATKDLLQNSPYSKNKEFIPRDEIKYSNKLTKYRVIEPIINAYDTNKICDYILKHYN